MFWFLLGTLGVGVLQWSHAQATGGLGGLIKVGEDHPLAERIMAEVPGIPVAPGLGHDGQIYYAIGLDLLGQEVPELMEPMEAVGYRYRRIGYPALASFFGILDGSSLLWGMVVVNAVSAGVAAAAAAAIASHFGRTYWVGLAVVLNPGVWLSALLSTADNLALAAGLVGLLALFKRRWRAAVAAFALAALTKEVALVFALGTAGYLLTRERPRSAASLFAGAASPLIAWTTFVQLRIGGLFETGANLGPPFEGIVQAASEWPAQSLQNNLLNGLVVTSAAAWIAVSRRCDRIWHWVIWPWMAVALLSARFVWIFGNNAIRVFAPLVVLVVIALVDAPASNPARSGRDRRWWHGVPETAPSGR